MNFKNHFRITVFTLFLCGNIQANSFTNHQLPENSDLVKAGDKRITLMGNQVSVGDIAPNFSVVNESFTPVSLQEFENNYVLISVVPSLDTGVCSLQTKRFNDEVGNLPSNVKMLTISNDLPFAQKRFCETEQVDKIHVLSDAVWHEFGSQYGLMIKDMGLLTRAIFIIDASGKIAYKELVENISNHPDYDTALAELKKLLPHDEIQEEGTSIENKEKGENN